MQQCVIPVLMKKYIVLKITKFYFFTHCQDERKIKKSNKSTIFWHCHLCNFLLLGRKKKAHRMKLA